MNKPVQNEQFWKERIYEIESDQNLHCSVYFCNKLEWDLIEKKHLLAIKKNIKEEENVLDAGCGYGRLSKNFCNYTGIDFSQDFINLSKKLNPEKKFLKADIKNLPFKDDEFDWAICSSIKQMIISNCGIDEWNIMQKELHRVCKKILILEYSEAVEQENYSGKVLQRGENGKI